MNNRYQSNVDKVLLYLDTRELPLERIGEIRAAKNQGYKILMATPTPAAYKGFGLDFVLDVNVGDFDKARPVILDYIATHQLNVTGILVWKDREVVLAAQLAEQLGIPGSSLQAVENVRNKSQTRAVLDQFEGANPRWAVVSDLASLEAGVANVGVPCVLKQAGNSGSRGMRVIERPEDAARIYDEFLTFNNSQKGDMYHYYSDIALVEEMVEGSEHSVAGVVADGKVYTFGIADKKFNRELPLQYENIIPSKLQSFIQQEVIELAQKAVAATGINWCGFHMDFMVTDQGIKILEIGGRLGGEMINSHLIGLAQPGLNPYEILIDVVQGESPLAKADYSQDFSSQVVSRVVMPEKTGTIQAISGVEKVRKDPRCREFMQTWGPGDEMVLPDVRFKGFEIGYFIAQAELNDDMDKVINELLSHITIDVA